MPQTNSFNIDRLFEGSLQRLRTEAEYFSRLTEHGPELGRMNETHLLKTLRDYLPPKFGIGTGFIVSGGKDPQQSPQCDIVLYDALNNAPLYKSEAWSIYPIEMVYGVIEVKTKLRQRDLLDAFQKCAKIRSMATTANGEPNKTYARQKPPKHNQAVQYEPRQSGLPPRFFVFAYDGPKTIAALERMFRKVSDDQRSAHIHGICSLTNEGSLFVRHEAFQKDDAKYGREQINGFRHFLLNLPRSLSSMLPIERLGLGFDLLLQEYYFHREN